MHPREQCRLGQRWPNVGTVVPMLGQRYPNLHCCLGLTIYVGRWFRETWNRISYHIFLDTQMVRVIENRPCNSPEATYRRRDPLIYLILIQCYWWPVDASSAKIFWFRSTSTVRTQITIYVKQSCVSCCTSRYFIWWLSMWSTSWYFEKNETIF